ncbi:hypothetical protein A3Q56_05200 [Intoshia linei]|uniref:Uncharacterized protein n=1 Tax=Intoshia linei TaxID=1819745 RepID=A0A177AYJ6_9BILA|nr:hypothetical protein A3Q56_05200 [Intoshia linei]
MSVSNIKSWKSSIRHACNQIWFLKFKFFNYEIRGAFWTINQNVTTRPKHWNLPIGREYTKYPNFGLQLNVNYPFETYKENDYSKFKLVFTNYNPESENFLNYATNLLKSNDEIEDYEDFNIKLEDNVI